MPGDTVNISVPAIGFVAWESDSDFADVEFVDGLSTADFIRTSFVVPEEPFFFFFLYDEFADITEGAFIFNYEAIEDGQVPVRRCRDATCLVQNCTDPAHQFIGFVHVDATCTVVNCTNPNHLAEPVADPIVLNWGMIGNRYDDFIQLHGFPGATPGEAGVTISVSNFEARQAGDTIFLPGELYFPHQRPINPDTGEPDGVMPPLERVIQVDHSTQRIIVGGTPDRIDLPVYVPFPNRVVEFSFRVTITFPQVMETRIRQVPGLVPGLVPDPDNVGEFIDGMVPGMVDEEYEVNITPRPILRIVEFHVLPRPEIERTLPGQIELTDPIVLPVGMVDVSYGNYEQSVPAWTPPAGNTQMSGWTQNTHFTRINVNVLDRPNFPPNPPAPQDPDNPTDAERIAGLHWNWEIDIIEIDGDFGSSGARLEGILPDGIVGSHPFIDIMISPDSPTVFPTRAPDEPATIRFRLRLQALAPHPGTGVAVPMPIGEVSREFIITILPRPQFGLNIDGEFAPSTVTGITPIAHAMDGRMADPLVEPIETNYSQSIIARGFPYGTDWSFSYSTIEQQNPTAPPGFPPIVNPPDHATDPGAWGPSLDFTHPAGLDFNPPFAPGSGGSVGLISAGMNSAGIELGTAHFTLSGIPQTYGRYLIAVEVDSLGYADNPNIQTRVRVIYELIIWQRTYLHIDTGVGAGLAGYVRRIDADGTEEISSANIEATANVPLYINRRAVMPGTMGMISARSRDFVRWEHNPYPPNGASQPSNIPPIGGVPGTNPSRPDHTPFTGHWRTDSHNYMVMRMPTPLNADGTFNPYTTSPPNVFIRALQRDEPFIDIEMRNGRVGNPAFMRGMDLFNSGEPDDFRPFRWVLVSPPPAGLGHSLIGTTDTAAILRENPTIAGAYTFTVGVYLQGSMRIDRTATILIDEPYGTRLGDVNDDGLVDYRDIILLQRVIRGEATLNERQFDNANINRDGTVNVVDLEILLEVFGIANRHMPSLTPAPPPAPPADNGDGN
jgi:hypothetical protein